ncbi:MAG: VPS10 domain-containing protein [Actinomycetota bacterium]
MRRRPTLKRPHLVPALVFLAVFALQACATDLERAIQRGAAETEGGRFEVEGREEESEEPGDTFLMRQLYGSEITPTAALRPALARAHGIARLTEKKDPRLSRLRWRMVGPTNIGGRLLDIAVDPDLPNTIYVAAASGGVWTSTNAGRTFKPAWPADEPQAIGALAMTRSGILYAGTGETGPGGGSMTYGGLGVYRSYDRGETWENIGLTGSSRISRIAIDPKNEDRIFVAASGPLFNPGGQRGLFRSTNGGDSWERVLRGDNATTGAVDIAIDPSNPQRIYAAMWDHLREPDRRRYTGIGSGLYRSSDGGDTWERIGLGFFGPHPAIGRIGVAVAPTAPQTLYATLNGESGTYAGVFKSTSGGDTWTPIVDPELVLNNYVYGWWFGRMWVDPKDENHVFHAGLDLLQSSDGGMTWGVSGGMHVDQHAVAWDPKVDGRVYAGNDGGLYRSDDNGTTWQFGRVMPWSQLYTIDVGQQSPERLVAGLQDNGVNRSYDAEGNIGPRYWNQYVGGDGLRASINPQNQDIVYGCLQYGDCYVSYNAGGNTESFGEKVVSSRKNWLTPIEFDPVNPSTLYSGGEILSRSDDDAGTWIPISPDLSNGPGRETNPLFINFGTITTIGPTPSDTGVLYVGTDDGNLWYTWTGGTTWTQASDPDLPTAWVTRVQADPRNPDVAYVTYSGFRQGDDAAYILRTTDGGVTWDDITGNLPKAPINDVNVIGHDLVVASDFGVFLSHDLGANWFRVGDNLPLAPIHELRWHKPTSTLYAATFGRSAWQVTFPSNF